MFKECGPDVNNGMGTYTTDSANYVDIFNYMDWIKNTMSGMYKNVLSCKMYISLRLY